MRFFIGFLAGVAAGYFLTSVLAQRTDNISSARACNARRALRPRRRG